MSTKTLIVVARGRSVCTFAYETLSRETRSLQDVEVVQELGERVFEMLKEGDYGRLFVLGYVQGHPERRLRRAGVDPEDYDFHAFFSPDADLVMRLLREGGGV